MPGPGILPPVRRAASRGVAQFLEHFHSLMRAADLNEAPAMKFRRIGYREATAEAATSGSNKMAFFQPQGRPARQRERRRREGIPCPAKGRAHQSSRSEKGGAVHSVLAPL